MAASRIQRWASFLAAFDYTILYSKGCDNNADAFSRLPLSITPKVNSEEKNYVNFILDSGNKIDHVQIKNETAKDFELSKVFTAVQSGHFDGLSNKQQFQPYLSRIDELSIEYGVLLWGYRVIIPIKLRPKMLRTVHASHFGIVKTKSLARSFMWWPGIDADIERMIKGCSSCLSVRPDPQKASLIPWQVPERVWSRVHIDFAGPLKKNYFLIITDAYSKWPEVFKTKEITSNFTVNKLREVFARFGLPETIVSDNGTQFTSGCFQKFVSLNNIHHITSAPGHPATNGAAENAVKSFKNGLKAALADGNVMDVDALIQRYLFDYRLAEHCTTGESPAKIMFNRTLRNRFSLCKPPTVEKTISDRLDKQVQNFKGKRDVTFELNERVSIRDLRDPNPGGKKWMPAIVTSVLGQRNYLCETVNDKSVVRRHVNQMHKCLNSNSPELKVHYKHTHTNKPPSLIPNNLSCPSLNPLPCPAATLNNNNRVGQPEAPNTKTKTNDTNATDVQQKLKHTTFDIVNKTHVPNDITASTSEKPRNCKNDTFGTNEKHRNYTNAEDITDLDKCLKNMFNESSRPKRNVKAPNKLNL